MVIWPEFRLAKYRDHDHWEEAPHFRVEITYRISNLPFCFVLAAIATSGFEASITPEDLKNFLISRPDLKKRGFRQIEIPAMPPRLNALDNDKRSEYGIDDYLQFWIWLEYLDNLIMSLSYEMLPVLFLLWLLDLYSMQILIINVNKPIYLLTVGLEH